MFKPGPSSSTQMTDASRAVVETPPNNSFTYTFSPGRSPFNDPLSGHCKQKDVEFDKHRVNFEDKTTFGQQEEVVEESLGPAKKLWEEITGKHSKKSCLHADAGFFSAPHVAGACLLSLGESFMTRSSFANNTAGRVMGTLSTYQGGLRVTSRVTLTDFKYEQGLIAGRYNNINGEQITVLGLTDNYPQYASYVEARENGEYSPAEMFLDGKMQVQCSFRYVSADSQQRPDVYEWRRRLDSYVLGNNIDEVRVLNLVDLAEAYRKKLEEHDGASCSFFFSVSEGSLGSVSQCQLVESGAATNITPSKSAFRNSIDGRSERRSISSPRSTPAPCYTDKNLGLQNLQVFANMQGLKDHLSQDIGACLEQFSGVQNRDHAGRLNFESNTLILSPEFMQSATQTVQNIRADLFLRRVRLAFIIYCLKDNRLPLWEHPENKIGLCETLLNDLEHPLIASDQAEVVDHIKTMRDDPLD
jgi:hypothetical protein